MIHLRILEIYAVRNWFYTQNIPVGYFAYTHAYIRAYTRNIRKIYNSVYPIFCTVFIFIFLDSFAASKNGLVHVDLYRCVISQLSCNTGVTGLRVPPKNCPAGHCILGPGVRRTPSTRIQCPAGQRILAFHVPP